jgi:hypothetical protein
MPYQFDKQYLAKTLIPALNAVVLQTELGGNAGFISRFSLAGSKSTYSFGLYQYDVGNNAPARNLLATFGFTPAQIIKLSQNGGLAAKELSDYNLQLKAALAIAENAAALRGLDSSWAQSLTSHLGDVLKTVAASGPTGKAIADQVAASTALQVQLLDYSNQFNISLAGQMVAWLEGHFVIMPGGKHQLDLHTALTKELIREFTMSTLYGQQHPESETTRENALFRVLKTIPAGLPPVYVDPNAPPGLATGTDGGKN